MSIRIKKIILEIIENPKVSFNELADIFGVSERSIRNDFQELNYILSENGFKEIKITHDKGLIFNSNQLKKCLNSINFYDYKLSKDERLYFIVETLISSQDYITISDLADKLYVSVSTINSDLKEVVKMVNDYKIEYISEPYKGIKIKGNEFSKRILLLDLICNNSSILNLGVYKTLDENFEDTGIDSLNQMLSYFESKNKIIMTDRSFKRVNTYLYIMIHRIRNDKNILINNIKYDKSYYKDAEDLYKIMVNEFGLEFNEAEIQAIANILSNIKYLRTDKVSNDIIKIQFYINRFIDSIKSYINMDLSNDYLFFVRLCLHVEYMTKEKIQHIADERILKEICDANVNVVSAVDKSMYILEELLDRKIKKIEKEYIVLHVCAAIERKKLRESGIKVAIVSDEGFAATQLLIEKIKNNFDFSISDVIPVHAVEMNKTQNIDLILSTTNLNKYNLSKPWVKVETNFSDENYSEIYKKVNRIKKEKLSETKKEVENNDRIIKKITNIIKDYNLKYEGEIISKIVKAIKVNMKDDDTEEMNDQLQLSELLDVDSISVGLNAKTWQESIDLSSNILLEKGYLEKRYIDAIKNKIYKDGPYMVIAKGFAVIHAGVDDGGLKTGFSLVKLKDPVDYNSPLGLVEFVCCLSVVDMTSHLKAFFSLVNLVQNNDFMHKLKKCNSSEEIHNLIKKYE